MIEPTVEQYSRVEAGATAALLAMIIRDEGRASVELAKLGALENSDEYGNFPVMYCAAIMWIDTLCDHMFAGNVPRKVVVAGSSMVRVDDANARTEFVMGSAHADMEVPTEFQWSSRAIVARMTRDAQKFDRLWDEAPSEPGEFGRHVLAVLSACAHTIRIEPRGYGFRHIVHNPGCPHDEDEQA